MTNTSQLPLLPPPPDAPTRLQLSDRTRRLGLAHVAAARALLDAAARARAEQEALEAAAAPTAAAYLADLRRQLQARAHQAAA